MISAVDTNVLLDMVTGDAEFGPSAVTTLRRASAEGQLIVSAAVWAEVAAAYDDPGTAASMLDGIGVDLVPDDRAVAMAAGAAWRSYRRAGGTRRRVLADFLIAAHATEKADRFVTRDRGFYRRHIPRLTILDPTKAGP